MFIERQRGGRARGNVWRETEGEGRQRRDEEIFMTIRGHYMDIRVKKTA